MEGTVDNLYRISSPNYLIDCIILFFILFLRCSGSTYDFIWLGGGEKMERNISIYKTPHKFFGSKNIDLARI